ncbi:hypothetical protein B0H14DRAFT_3448163 [Mycena olivaceomarginata]|nr:hypothetical protein B0H14DRAFT_3448163 [Mycena olivaceomarginata]
MRIRIEFEMRIFADLSTTSLSAATLSSLLVENQAAPLSIEVSPTLLVGCLGLSTIASAHPYLVPYTGPTLFSESVYLWTVTVATRARTASAASFNLSTCFLAQDEVMLFKMPAI